MVDTGIPDLRQLLIRLGAEFHEKRTRAVLQDVLITLGEIGIALSTNWVPSDDIRSTWKFLLTQGRVVSVYYTHGQVPPLTTIEFHQLLDQKVSDMVDRHVKHTNKFKAQTIAAIKGVISCKPFICIRPLISLPTDL